MTGRAATLWTPVDASWEPWLREWFASTVAAAALSAVLSLCPEIDGSGLVVDIDAGPSELEDVCTGDARHQVWISELAPGGNGCREPSWLENMELCGKKAA